MLRSNNNVYPKCPVTKKGIMHMIAGIELQFAERRGLYCIYKWLCLWLNWLSNAKEGSKYLYPGRDPLDRVWPGWDGGRTGSKA